MSYSATAVLHGSIVDLLTRAPITNALVRLAGGHEDRDAVSDSAGNFVVGNLAPGAYSVSATADAYEPVSGINVLVKTGFNDRLCLELTRTEPMPSLAPMTVTALSLSSGKLSQVNSVFTVSPFELHSTAGTANDINRVLQSLPAVAPRLSGQFDNTLLVRGGGPEENSYVVDGIELESIDHFSHFGSSGGQLSFINSDAVEKLSFYAGGMPVSLPPSLSSVADITVKSGATRYSTQCDFNASGLGGVLEGPVGHAGGSYLLSGRAVDFSFMKSLGADVGQFPSYEDLLGKTGWYFGGNDHVSLTFIASRDRHEEGWMWYGDSALNVDKTTVTAAGTEWRHSFSKGYNQCNISLVGRKQNGSIDMRSDTVAKNLGYSRKKSYSDEEEKLQVKDQVSLLIGDRGQMDVGAYTTGNLVKFYKSEYTVTNARLDSSSGAAVVRLTAVEDRQNGDRTGEQAGVFAQYVLSARLVKLVAGIRADYYTLLKRYGISPRIAVAMRPRAIGEFSLSGGLYQHYPTYLTFADFTTISKRPADFALQRNWQGVAGYNRKLWKTHTLTIESFFKWYDRELLHATPEEPELPSVVSQTGKKSATGVEVQLAKAPATGFHYSLGYSYALAKERYADGKWYADESSIGHALHCTAGFTLASHGITGSLNISEGRPYTPKIVVGTPIPYQEAFDGRVGYNSRRRDPMLSANVRYSLTLYRSWGTVGAYLDLMNALNRRPVIDDRFNGTGFDEVTVFGFLPIGGISVSF